MNALERLTQLSTKVYNQSAADWKQRGKRVVGYMCSYVPEEIFYAAGILPIRIGARGCKNTTLADAHMAPITCSFTRCVLEMALTHEYDFLDGLVFMNGCENMRRMCDNWISKISIPFNCCLSVPYKTHEDAVEWYSQELDSLKRKLEATFSVSISNSDLLESIRMVNKSKQLLKELYDLRKRPDSPISGTQAQRIVVMASAMPKNEFNELLEEVIHTYSQKNAVANYRARMMVIGNMLDDYTYTELIEQAGGLVVTDVTCYGTLYFWRAADSTTTDSIDSTLNGLARSYLNNILCPRMPFNSGNIHNLIEELTRTFNVDGIIFERMMYCNLWGGESMALEKDINEIGIPFLTLDRQYIPSGEGQIRTRIQAFLEMIGRQRK
ncbi:MAG: 2-hydroxyacyl-CoA dehydratase family protein [Dehalococcoidia bacterium]|jgi:benzoyl-CoA reductase/2-hydroxyglutaryl-CoA dehydratase subunit BcrC/BadD/HgdB